MCWTIIKYFYFVTVLQFVTYLYFNILKYFHFENFYFTTKHIVAYEFEIQDAISDTIAMSDLWMIHSFETIPFNKL